ncbi:hypothetical protein FRB96_006295 [Tulasnella sp. 330]|nr:hypothetical protein FRB96_006295 [Tulasnella sp. 330]
MFDVLLVGYGAVGVVFAYILQNSGRARVTVVARSNYEAAKNGQIVINSASLGKITDFKPYRVVASVAEAVDRPYRFVLVSTKAMPDVSPTSKLLAPLLATTYSHPQPTYVLVQNGMGVEKDLYAKLLERDPLGSPRIISCAVFVTAQADGNVINNNGMVPKLDIGVYKPKGGATAASSSQNSSSDLEEFKSVIEAGGGAATIKHDIQAAKNVMMGTVCSLTRVPGPFFLVSPDLWVNSEPLLMAIGEEVVSVGRALGFTEQDFPSSAAEDNLRLLRSLKLDVYANVKPSMLVDIEAGRSFELEVIVGEVVRTGRSLGVKIPLLESTYTMLSLVQAYILRPPPAPESPTTEKDQDTAWSRLPGWKLLSTLMSSTLQYSGLADQCRISSTESGKIVIEGSNFGNVTDLQPYRVVSSVAEAADTAYKYVVVATKSLPDVWPTSKILEPLIAPSYSHSQPTYVLLQNGLGVENDLYEALSERPHANPQIITCAVFMASNMVGNVVQAPSTSSRLEIGMYDPKGTAAGSAEQILSPFARMIEAGGEPVALVNNIQASKFKKNLWNVLLNVCSCQTRVPLAFYIGTASVWDKVSPLLSAIGKEILAVGYAMGFSKEELPSDWVEEVLTRSLAIVKLIGLDSNMRPSSLVDIEAGRPFEVEVIFGEVVRLGQRLSVPTPLLEASYTMLAVTQAYNRKTR